MTMIEALLAITLMLIMAGTMTLGYGNFAKQSAKYEAEKAAAYIHNRLRMADITRDVLWFTARSGSDSLELKRGAKLDSAAVELPKFTLQDGCKFSHQSTVKLVYNVKEDTGEYKLVSPNSTAVASTISSGGKFCLTVTDSENRNHYVLIGK